MSSPLSVLVFAMNYHPEPTGSAPYMTRLARHLARTHAVTVVTGHPHYPSWRVQHAASERTANPRVLRYRHFVPRRPTAVGRALYELSWLSSAARSMVKGRRYDVILSAIPTLSAGMLGLLAGRRHRSPVGLVFHDLIGPGASQSGVTSARTARSLARIEAGLARGASQLAVLCEDFLPYLLSRGIERERIVRFRNWGRLGRPVEGVEETRRRLGWHESEFVCLHAGNMGQKQGLETVIEAARLLPSRGVRLVLAGDGNDRENLMAQAGRAGVENLTFLPIQPAGRYESMLQAADVLLLNQRHTVREMSIPSKLTAYFWAGRPILAAIGADSAAAREIARANAGLVIAPGDPRLLADAIFELRASADDRRTLGDNGRQYAQTVLQGDADLHDYDDFVWRLAGGESRRGDELLA